MNQSERMRLLNPGPVTLTPRVRRALDGPDLCHREPEFAALQADVRARLAAVYPGTAGRYEAVMLTGSGTAAVEAMLASFVAPGAGALVLANGAYGERIAAILRLQGKAVEVVRSAWTEPMVIGKARRSKSGKSTWTFNHCACSPANRSGTRQALGAYGLQVVEPFLEAKVAQVV